MKKRRLILFLLAAGMVISGLPYRNLQAAEKEEPVALTQEMVDEANEQYNDNEDALLEFVSMSDTHVASYESKKWAFQNIEDWSEEIGFHADTVLVDGDVEANEREEQPGNSVRFYTAVEQLMEETFGDLPIQFSTGNHDIQSNMEAVFDENGWDGIWHYKSETGDTYNNYHLQINGFDFITLDYRNGSRYRQFLQDTLEKIKSRADYDDGKPIFIQIHSGVNGTTTGSYQDCGNTSTYLQGTLADWPQAIVMTAHSHYSSEVEDGIYQKNFTVVNNGSMDYVEVDDSRTVENEVVNWVQGNLEDGHYELTCNYITVMKDGTTVIRRFDVTNKRWMGVPWVIDTEEGKEGFRYTSGKRSTTAPWFEEDAEISVENVGETTADLVFDQAVDDQLTEYYRVTVRNFLTNEDAVFKVLPENYDYAGNSSYEVPKGFTGSFDAYSRYYLRPYPEQMKFYLSDLQPNTRYRIIVQAFDSFDNASLVKDVVFKTEGETVELPNVLPETVEDGKFLDMSFDDSSLTDSEGQITATAAGNISYAEGMDGTGLHIPSTRGAYVDLGGDERMNGDSTFTMNFWINARSTSGDAAVISNKNWGSGGNPGWYVGFRLSNLSSIGVNASDGSRRIDFDGSAGFQDNWKMVTIMFDREENVSRIFIDGNESMYYDLSSITGSMATDYSVKIGSDGTGNYGSRAEFTLDSLQMWDRALTDEEILAIYGTAVYEEDTTDYAEKLQELIEQAEALLAEYEAGAEGVYYNEETAVRLKEQAEAAKGAQTTEEQQIFCGELSYLIEKMEMERQWTTIDKSGFTVAECDSWHGDHGEGNYGTSRLYAPEKAIDSNNSTAWHTSWTAGEDGTALYKFPHSIIIDMQESYSISGIERVGRGERDYIKDFTVEAADDLETLTSEDGGGEEGKASGTFDDTEDAFHSFGKALKGRYIKVTIHDTWLMQDAGNEGKQWAYTAELNFTGHKVSDEKTVTATTDGNGTVSPVTMTVLAGEDAVLAVVPEKGYQIQSVKVTGASGEKEFILDGTTLTIQDVQEDLTVSVSFEKEQAVTPDPVDKSKLDQAIADAMYILENRENYQADTLEGLEAALENAQAAAQDPDADQAAVDQAAALLEKEIQEVRPVESDPPVPGEDSSQGGDSQNGGENMSGQNGSGSGQAVKTGDSVNLAAAVLAVSGCLLAFGAALAVIRRRKVR